MQRLWTTDIVPQPDRLSYWVDAVCSTYTSLACRAVKPEVPFFGHIDSKEVGNARLTYVRSSAQTVRRTQSCIAQDAEDMLLFSVQKAGRCNVVQDGRVATLEPGDFALYDTTRPYELIFKDDLSQYVVAFPGKTLRPHLLASERLTAQRIRGNSRIGRALHYTIGSVTGEPNGLVHQAAHPMEDALRGLLVAGVISRSGTEKIQDETALSARRAIIMAYVLQNLSDPELGVRSIAAYYGVNASTVHRAFNGEGKTLSRWLWGQRLMHAYRDMQDHAQSGKTLTEIAFSWGFSDMTHFSRAFKAKYGLSPRAARRHIGDQ